jgi:hypothetical protein
MPGSNRVPRAALVGDPFFPAVLAAYGAIKKGVQVVKAIKNRGQVSAQGAPPPMSAMVQNPGLYIPPVPRAGSGTGHRAPQGGSVTATSRVLPALPPGSRIQSFPAGVGAYRRRYRRMNVLNLRALKRAIRRAKGFEHIARQVLTIPHHFKRHIRARGRKR